MEKTSEQLVTKEQLENIYTAWGTTASVPGMNKKNSCAGRTKSTPKLQRRSSKVTMARRYTGSSSFAINHDDALLFVNAKES